MMQKDLKSEALAIFKNHSKLQEVYINEQGVGFVEKHRAEASQKDGKIKHFKRSDLLPEKIKQLKPVSEEVNTDDSSILTEETKNTKVEGKDKQEPTERELLVAEYEQLIGKKPVHNMTVHTLKERIANAKEEAKNDD